MSEAAFFCDTPERLAAVYGHGRRENLEVAVSFLPEVMGTENFDAHLPELREVRYIFSTWTMPRLSASQLEYLPNLEVLFYAAGHVDDFAGPYLDRGTQVVSAAAVNAEIVAAFTASQILLAAKGYYASLRRPWDTIVPEALTAAYPGTMGTTVSLLGAGRVGRRVLGLLQAHQLEWLVFDPLLSAKALHELGAEKVGLEEAFERGRIVSNHLADVPETRGLLTGSLFETLPHGATFINTGRGATVDEPGLVRVFELRPDLTALLDVTNPEPPAPGSPMYTLENVLYTPHIAGAAGLEVLRLADCVIEEFNRYRQGKPLRHACGSCTQPG